MKIYAGSIPRELLKFPLKFNSFKQLEVLLASLSFPRVQYLAGATRQQQKRSFRKSPVHLFGDETTGGAKK